LSFLRIEYRARTKEENKRKCQLLKAFQVLIVYSFTALIAMNQCMFTAVCKFWLNPLVLSKNKGFSPKNLNSIREIILSNMTIIMEAWHEHCG